jgi:hypothetical protein
MSGGMSLFLIAKEHREAIDKLYSTPGLDEQTLLDTLESMGGEFEGKVLSVAAFIRNLEAAAAAQKSAEKDMADRRKVNEAKATRLRTYLLECMEHAERDHVDSPNFCVKVKVNPPAVVVTDEDALKFNPDASACWKLIPETEQLDKTALKALLLAGTVLAGAHIDRGNRVEIK